MSKQKKPPTRIRIRTAADHGTMLVIIPGWPKCRMPESGIVLRTGKNSAVEITKITQRQKPYTQVRVFGDQNWVRCMQLRTLFPGHVARNLTSGWAPGVRTVVKVKTSTYRAPLFVRIQRAAELQCPKEGDPVIPQILLAPSLLTHTTENRRLRPPSRLMVVPGVR